MNSSLIQKEIIVLVAHYNDNENLKKCLMSFDEDVIVDVLIVDDGSKTKPVLTDLQKCYKVGEVFIIYLEQNLGYGQARNHGLELISQMDYKYIGIMDSDDLNKKNRFSTQFSFLEQNTETKLIGSWCECIDEQGKYLYTHKYPTTYEQIKKKMYFNMMVANPTHMFRSEILKTVGYYPIKYKVASDYGFVFNVIKHYKVENLPQTLIFYTIKSSSWSSVYRNKIIFDRLRIIKDNFYFGFYPIAGILRNVAVLLIPRKAATFIKSFLDN